MNLGPLSGAGLVIAAMIGTGVFLCSGYMIEDLSPALVLAAWGLGAVLAITGCLSYASLSRLIPRSGGEYRYLHDLGHPSFGVIAGWTSLMVGFSAPAAADAIASIYYLNTVFNLSLDPRPFASGVVLLMTLVHFRNHQSSHFLQNLLVVLKVVAVAAFMVLGLFFGTGQWPGSAQEGSVLQTFPFAAFMTSLLLVNYAFSGWGSAVYVSSEFRDARRDVARAMVGGCLLVATLYFGVNWVFLTRLRPEQLASFKQAGGSGVTLGHWVAQNILGDAGALVMSGVIILVFLSALSALIYVGPRIYSAMAEDGFLPPVFRSKTGNGVPPAACHFLQCGISILLIYTHSLRQILENAGAVLTFMSAAAVGMLFLPKHSRKLGSDFAWPRKLVSAFYVLLSCAMVFVAIHHSPLLVVWIGVMVSLGWVAHRFQRRPVQK